MNAWDIGLMIAAALVTIYVAQRFMHMLQLESYQTRMYLKCVMRNFGRDWLPAILVFIICISLDAALPYVLRTVDARFAQYYVPAQIGIRVLYIVIMLSVGLTWRGVPERSKFNRTARIKRLMVATALVIVLINLCSGLVRPAARSLIVPYVFSRSMFYAPALLLPFVVLLAHFITYPIEQLNKQRYLISAMKKLESRPDLKRIGITGSYGKTSTKFILGKMLAQKYDTLVPPQNYNTPMGITRVVREQLLPEHEVFVAEMGARYTGDIAELCNLVHPQIGILTSVGPQHLETFGNLQNVIATKYELIEALPADGAAFFNADNEVCRMLYDKCELANKYLYGVDSLDETSMRAGDLETTPQGSKFELLSKDGECVVCTTKLLGKHNILNITGCAAVARYMGVSMEEVAAVIAELEPVEHRLQLIAGPITVIDDAYNSNPAGAQAAMEVLRTFPGRHIVVTPGMIELGKETFELNRAFGKEIAASAEYVILVGTLNQDALREGLKDGGFDMECTRNASNIDEATEILAELTKTGDVVLFENDLPDNYK